PPGAALAPINATYVLFRDDDRLLTLVVDRTNAVVREVSLPTRAVAWEQQVPNVHVPRLSYRASTHRWMVTGMSLEGRLVAVEANVGSAELQRREWNMAGRGGGAGASRHAA